jgi:hypothetical protein
VFETDGRIEGYACLCDRPVMSLAGLIKELWAVPSRVPNKLMVIQKYSPFKQVLVAIRVIELCEANKKRCVTADSVFINERTLELTYCACDNL